MTPQTHPENGWYVPQTLRQKVVNRGALRLCGGA